MVEGIALAILGKIGEYLVAPIGRQFKYLFCYNSNIQNLRDQIKKLEVVSEGVEQLVTEAENNLKVPARLVQEWRADVEKMKKESDRIFNKDKDNGCLNGWCPNPKSRFLLSREATKAAQETARLENEGKPYNTNFPSLSVPPAASMPTPTAYVGFESRKRTTEGVINALKNDNIGIIGICGMGGVGKTKMVKDVGGRAKSENFDEVATAVVSQSPDMIKIQGQLADMMRLKFEPETSIEARACYLRARLTNGRRILVILDDVWQEIDLNEIGIPFGEDRKGCKVVLTSRDEQVCRNMRADKIFTVKVLSGSEAWDLFKVMAGKCVDTADIRDVAGEVAKECGGLPLAIVTVGNALRDKEKYEWDDALHQLRKSIGKNIDGVDKNLYSKIKWSYDYLKNKQAKSLLLVCCVLPEDAFIPIESLVRYAAGLQLFEDGKTMDQIRNRVYTLVGVLRRCYLLLDDDNKNNNVKVHDIIRDVGLSIAKDEHGYEMQQLSPGLYWPKLELLWESGTYTKIEISREYFEGLKEVKVIDFCAHAFIKPLPPSLQFLMNLRTLCLHDCRGLGADISLIGNLQGLEILSFFRSEIDVLPSEIVQLRNLKLLDLRCELSIIDSGVLSRLKELEELYMGHYFHNYANVEEKCAIITELNSLSGLNTLQISIPRGPEFLLKLRNFQFENLHRFEFLMHKVYANDYQLRKNSVSFCQVDTSVILESNINVLMRRTEELELSRVRGLKNVVKDLDEEGIVKLKRLKMSECGEVEYVVDAKDSVVPSSAFIFKLESLDIGHMDNLTEICHGNLPERSFEQLQVLNVERLPAMRHLWRGPIQPPCLANLRSIYLGQCPTIKFLFPQSVVKCLVQLQTLRMMDCNGIEGIVSKEEGEIDEEIIEFPKLIELGIQRLPKFMSFYTRETETEDNLGFENNDDDSSIQALFNPQIRYMENLTEICHGNLPERSFEQLQVLNLYSLPAMRHLWRGPIQPPCLANLRSICLIECPTIKFLFPQSVVKCLVQLQTLTIQFCYGIEGIVSKEGRETHEKIIEFPKLIELEIIMLPKFRSFYTRETETEDNLGFENNDDDSSIQALFNPQVLLPSMGTLSVELCESLESVFDFGRLKEHAKFMLDQLTSMYLINLPKLTHIWRMVPQGFQGFHNLRVLEVIDCGCLRYLFSPSMAKMVVNLQELKLISCQIMEQVIQTQEEEVSSSKMKTMDKFVFPQLQLLQLENLENLRMFCFEKHDFELPLLEKVLVQNCPNMETFCSGSITTPKLERIYVERDYSYRGTRWDRVDFHKWIWRGDLNSTIAFLKQRSEDAFEGAAE